MSDPTSGPASPAQADPGVTAGTVRPAEPAGGHRGDHHVVGSPDSAPDSAPDGPARRITRADVAHLARLARLAVSEDELDVFAGQLDVILSAVARVSDVAAEEIPPTSHAVPMTNVYRPDEVRPSLPRAAVLAGAPAVEDDKFRVPRILAEEV